jgi:hypothetical protein
VFARRLGGGHRHDEQRSASTGNKEANEWSGFHFQIVCKLFVAAVTRDIN